MTPRARFSRRDFLKVSALTGGGLVVAVYLSGCEETPSPTRSPAPAPTEGLPSTATTLQTLPADATPATPAGFIPGIYLKIGSDGVVTVTVHRSEMGQGVRTALPMIVAEELGADWTTIRVEQAPADQSYGNQTTGGSQSIQRNYLPLRQAGAVARELLIAAAAQTWGAERESCYTENGMVTNRATGEQLPFAALVSLAGTLPVPEGRDVPLKDPQEFRLIGKRVGRIDNPDIVTGKAVFGLDIRQPEMLFAVVARSPVLGGSVSSYDDSNALKIPGVRQVVQIDSGLAVVAADTWSAIRGRQALEVTWDEAAGSGIHSAEIEQELLAQAEKDIPARPDELAASYVVPFYSHATMEPMNCTAAVSANSCEVWAPTQNPQAVKEALFSLTPLMEDEITVHIPLLGGGFGRRLSEDYATEAVQISQAIGVPVKVMWTREDDIQHDVFHPLSVTRVSARLVNIRSLASRRFHGNANIPTGPWRSVTNVPEAFAHESFIDEFAAATNQDPIELRRQMLSDRAMAVVELAAEKAGWGAPLPAGHALGIAYHATWDVSPVAEVAEVSVDGEGRIIVHRVVCAVDCGTVINPDIVEAQMEGGIIFGLSAALKEPITIIGGRVQQSNFHDYPLLRLDETPPIEVYIVPSTERPTGIGEMANPPIAPAVANAVFAATGQRIRRLPIRLTA